MVIHATNELVDLFFQESQRSGVRAGVEAILAEVNKQVEREHREKLRELRRQIGDIPSQYVYGDTVRTAALAIMFNAESAL